MKGFVHLDPNNLLQAAALLDDDRLHWRLAMNRKPVTVVAFLLLFLGGQFLRAELPKIRILETGESIATSSLQVATINRTASNWALYVGLHNNYFKEEGIELKLTVAGSSSRLIAGIFDDKIQIGHMAAGNVIRSVDKGEDLFIFMGINRPLFSLVVDPTKVRTIEDLRGKRLGVDNSRTGYIYLVREFLRRSGIPDEEYQILDVGGVDARYRALLAGQVDAALLSVPRDIQALALGYPVVATIDKLARNYTGSTAVTRRSWANSNSGVLTAYIRGYRKAIHWLYDPANEHEASRILSTNLQISEPTARRIYQDAILNKRWLLTQGEVYPEGLEAVGRQMGMDLRTFDANSYLDLSYYEAAVGQGER